MNIFKEMGLAVYSFKSYKEFLKNRKGKVFLFAVVVMFFYFLLTMVVPFLRFNGMGLASAIEENVPEFSLEDGVLQVDSVIQMDDGDTCIWIDTNPEEVFYDAAEMASYYYGYTNVILMDSEKILVQSNGGAMQQVDFDELDFEFSKKDLMTIFFFLGVLFVALIGMIVASCMKYQLTFGQLYLLSIYSRVLPLLIKALVSFLPFTIPYFWVINFGISIVILALAIKAMKEDMLQQQNHYDSSANTTWMQ